MAIPRKFMQKVIEHRRPNITESQKAKFKKEFLELYADLEMPISKVVAKIGISRPSVYTWADTDPDFAIEFERLREMHKGVSEEKFLEKHKNDEEYKKRFLELYADESHTAISALKEIDKKLEGKHLTHWARTDFEFKKQYKALQKKLRPNLARETELRSSMVSAVMQEKQKRFLELFRKYNYNATSTAKAMGMKRRTVESWCKQNPDFAAEIENIQREKEDFAENALIELVKKGDTVATIYLTKILLKYGGDHFRKHAYVEQPQRGELTVKHEYSKETIDAVVRAAELSSGKLFELPHIQQQKQIAENAVDAEYEEVQ